MPQTQLQFHPSSLCGRRIRREKRFYATLKNPRSSLFHFLPRFSVERNNPHLLQLAMPLCDFLILWFYPQDEEKGMLLCDFSGVREIIISLDFPIFFFFFFRADQKMLLSDFLIFEILLDHIIIFFFYFVIPCYFWLIFEIFESKFFSFFFNLESIIIFPNWYILKRTSLLVSYLSKF